MSKNKLEKFAENLRFTNFFQPSYHDMKEGFPLKSKWNQKFFKNDNPLVVEFGCGRGEYSVGLAQKYPHKNFIGIDIKGARMHTGLTQAEKLGLKNVAFIRAKAENAVLLFGKNEVDEVWITFPDPNVKYRRRHKRMTSQKFLERYSEFCKTEALFHLKTDNKLMYDFTLQTIEENNHRLLFYNDDIYANSGFEDVKSIQTKYEKMFSEKGFSIKYVQFKLSNEQ